MPDFPGYRRSSGGYYRIADDSGPYSIDSSGAATLQGTAGAASQALPAGTNRSGSITVGGTAQQLAAANAARVSLRGQNIGTSDLWLNEIGGTAAIDGVGSYKVSAGGTFSVNTNRAVSIVGATTGQKFTATET